VFGSIAVLLLVVAALIFAKGPRPTITVLSALAPCVPLLYFAGRGFRVHRIDAFESLPQRACALTAAAFAVLALFLGGFGGTWAFSAGPAIAAFAFALCVTPIRDFVRDLGALV
jgi:hypothetical protein